MASVPWYGEKIGEGYQRPPPITSIMQERVDDPTWTETSAIVFVLDTQAASTFELRQYDMGFSNAARLTVQFSL